MEEIYKATVFASGEYHENPMQAQYTHWSILETKTGRSYGIGIDNLPKETNPMREIEVLGMLKGLAKAVLEAGSTPIKANPKTPLLELTIKA